VLGGLPTPTGILSLGPDRIRAVGMSRAKAAAMISLGQMQVVGEIDVDDLVFWTTSRLSPP
jgi:3-methyladenine DNA glycosylase/8-oxoguanine DNA glycosylase